MNKTVIWVAIILGLSLIIFGFIQVGYKYTILRAEQQEKLRNQAAIQLCFTQAEEDYRENWNKQCQSLGFEDECSLTKEHSQFLEKAREDQRQDCLLQIPRKFITN